MTGPFKSDFKRLSENEREMFRTAVKAFNESCDRFAKTKGSSPWPGNLRVKSVVNAPGIYEFTWSFAGPDGRATWEWTTIANSDGVAQPGVRWRRIGGHRIFREP